MSSTLHPRAAYALWAASYPPQAHNPLMLAEERAALALLPADLTGQRVLDAGCGSGRYLRHARQRGTRALLGIDLSWEMLRRVQEPAALVQASLTAIPVQTGWADVTICGLTIGHLPELRTPLAELVRITRPGGLIVCSDFHPAGAALGWRREFSAAGQTYAVQHTAHQRADWDQCCAALNLRIMAVAEPHLDPADIPPDAVFDRRALTVPVALVFALERL